MSKPRPVFEPVLDPSRQRGPIAPAASKTTLPLAKSSERSKPSASNISSDPPLLTVSPAEALIPLERHVLVRRLCGPAFFIGPSSPAGSSGPVTPIDSRPPACLTDVRGFGAPPRAPPAAPPKHTPPSDHPGVAMLTASQPGSPVHLNENSGKTQLPGSDEIQVALTGRRRKFDTPGATAPIIDEIAMRKEMGANWSRRRQ